MRKFHKKPYDTQIVAYATFDCVFDIWAAVIGISYYQWLNEEDAAPSNPIVMETLLHLQKLLTQDQLRLLESNRKSTHFIAVNS